MSVRTNKFNPAVFNAAVAKLPLVLKQMGWDGLREGQDKIIYSLMGSVDTLGVLPTGTGKTGCFVVPMLCRGWKTIVFSPLVALMHDQVRSLTRAHISVNHVSGLRTETENAEALDAWSKGNLQMLYVAPERLQNKRFRAALAMVHPDMVGVDEAHVVSQWSDNFRHSYCMIGDFVAEHNPEVVMACTATCPPEVEADIRRVLAMPNATMVRHYPRRTNLHLHSRDFTDPADVISEAMDTDGTALIYAATIKNVEEIFRYGQDMYPEELGLYHGELPDADKRRMLMDFMDGRKRVIVATNAFGMGIDKADIRKVVHYDHPGTLEALQQEVGRAGRDGKDSSCITYFGERALRTQQFFIDCGNPSRHDIESVYRTLRLSAGPDKVCYLTLKELAEKSGASSFAISAVMEALSGARVVERPNQETKTISVKFKKHEPVERFIRLSAHAEDLGALNASGFLEVDLEQLARKCSVTEPTVQTWLKNWSSTGALEYIPPFRGKPTRLIGRLENVNFERLEHKAELARLKLRQVLTYHSIPDKDKHAYLEKYFLTGKT